MDVITFFQNKHQPSKVKEPATVYGFATKTDIENLTHLTKHLNREIENQKNRNAGGEEAGAKGKK